MVRQKKQTRKPIAAGLEHTPVQSTGVTSQDTLREEHSLALSPATPRTSNIPNDSKSPSSLDEGGGVSTPSAISASVAVAVATSTTTVHLDGFLMSGERGPPVKSEQETSTTASEGQIDCPHKPLETLRTDQQDQGIESPTNAGSSITGLNNGSGGGNSGGGCDMSGDTFVSTVYSEPSGITVKEKRGNEGRRRRQHDRGSSGNRISGNTTGGTTEYGGVEATLISGDQDTTITSNESIATTVTRIAVYDTKDVSKLSGSAECLSTPIDDASVARCESLERLDDHPDSLPIGFLQRPVQTEATAVTHNAKPRMRQEQGSIYLQSLTFNQDGSCFAAATTRGFRVFTCSPLSEFTRRESWCDPQWQEGHLTCVAMLYRTHIFAFVPRPEPKKVRIWDDRARQVIGEIRNRRPVANVILGSEVIAVVSDRAVYIYLAEPIAPLFVINTCYNPLALCALSPGQNGDRGSWRIAVPAVTLGAIRIQTRANDRTSFIFQAHQSSIGSIAMSNSGSLVATASVVGTVIRVFLTSDGSKVYDFRLGSLHHVVRCITFRPDGEFIAVSSNSRTVHIFKLSNNSNQKSSNLNSDIESQNGDGQETTEGDLMTSTNSNQVDRQSTNQVDSESIKQPAPASPTNKLNRPSGMLTPQPPPTDGPRSIAMFASNRISDVLKDCNNQITAAFFSRPHTTTSTAASSTTFTSPSAVSAVPFPSVTAAYNQGREFVQDRLKVASQLFERSIVSLPSGYLPQGVLPKLLGGARSFAQFRIPTPSSEEMDVRVSCAASMTEHACKREQEGGACPGLAANPLGFYNRATQLSRYAGIPQLPPPPPPPPSLQQQQGVMSGGGSYIPQTCACGYGDTTSVGPLCAFAGEKSNHLFVIHHDGFFYEIRFDPHAGGSCRLLNRSPFFAPRESFTVKAAGVSTLNIASRVKLDGTGLSEGSLQDGWQLC